jgi:hypothetical protein
MLPDPETHHEPHRTGHRWGDLSIALAAILMSMVSLFVAIGHGRTMERMADANARLVAANSWPFLQYDTSNLRTDGSPALTLAVANVGVGPARIESLEIWWHDQPVASAEALLEACCGAHPAPAGSPRDDPRRTRYSQGLVASRVLRAGEVQTMIDFPHPDVAATAATAVWDRLNTERVNLRLRACYCDVFDDCWVSGLVGTKATRVAACPVAAVPFGIPGTERLRP